MIQLDNNYRIEPDGPYLRLVREYEYEKVNSKTRKPTGEVGVKEESWWDQHIRGLLKIYLKQIGHNETLEEIVEKYDNLEEKINNLPVLTQKKLQWN